MKRTIIKAFLLICSVFIAPLAIGQEIANGQGSDIYLTIDSSYNIGNSVEGSSKAKLTVKNNGATLATGFQFRIFYDQNAFASASIQLLGSTDNLILQSVDNNANGYITATVVYTGTSDIYTIPTGERFEITFTHRSAETFYSLPSIGNLTWEGSAIYPAIAAAQTGLDVPLMLTNNGGVWDVVKFNFAGSFQNVTGAPAKNLKLALEKKPKTVQEWTVHNTYITDANGLFNMNEMIDTTYYDVRLAIQGDTMSVGNVISTADAEKINQWVLGTTKLNGFDYYTGDINNSGSVTITDAYGVFGRIAGRFTSWPNNVKDIKFFTEAEYNTIVSDTSTNYTQTIPGVTNFYYNIGAINTVKFYVLVPGDANATGYNMARLTPIETTISTVVPAAEENIIDMSTEYDFPTSNIELKMPSLKVNEGNLVEIPVTVKTNGKSVSALQLSMMYNPDLLEFKELQNSQKSMFWISSINNMNGEVEWAGYDPSIKQENMITSDYDFFVLKFLAKQPQSDWGQSPLYTTRKFSGDNSSIDLSIVPTNGILVVAKIRPDDGSVGMEKAFAVYPNPTTGEIHIDFLVDVASQVQLLIINPEGKVIKEILNKRIPDGHYSYEANINNVSKGVYFATLNKASETSTIKIIKQ